MPKPSPVKTASKPSAESAMIRRNRVNRAKASHAANRDAIEFIPSDGEIGITKPITARQLAENALANTFLRAPRIMDL